MSLKPGNRTWWLTAGLTAMVSLSACGDSEPSGPSGETVRASVLGRAVADIVAVGLSVSADAEFSEARGRVTRDVSTATRTRTGSLPLARTKIPALLADQDFKAARADAAQALGATLDPTLEDDEASAQQTIAILLAQMEALSPGATTCADLRDRADACVVTLLIIEVKRSEGRSAPSMRDAGAVVVSDASTSTTPEGSAKDGGAPAVTGCSDPYEKNDSIATASPLSFDTTNKASLQANVDQRGPDYYALMPVRRDPVLITASYSTAPALAWLSMSARDTTGTTQWIKGPQKEAPSATLSGWLMPTKVGAAHHIELERVTGSCIPYTLDVDLNGCTDAYEDNDYEEQAKPIVGDQEHAATIIGGDNDWYDVSAVTATKGSCTLRYTLAKASDLGLSVTLYDTAGETITLVNATGTGVDKSNVVRWSGKTPGKLRVENGWTAIACLPYTLRCSAE